MRKLPARLALIALSVVAVAAPTLASTASGTEKHDSIAVIRQGTAKYHDIDVALSEGWVRTRCAPRWPGWPPRACT